MINRNYISFLSLIILMLINFSSLSAQVTEGFNYQAVARDALGEILPDTDIELIMSITIDPNGPGVVYSEEHLVTSDVFGMVNVVIGEGAPANGVFDEIDWNDSEHFLMIRMVFDGIDVTLPPVKFQAVPYAKVAATTSDKLWQETGETDMSIYYNDGPVGIGTLEPQRSLEIAQEYEDVFLRLHSQGSPAGSAMIELVRGSEFSATDWRLGNLGNGFAFQRASDNFLSEPDETPLFISNAGRVGIGETSPTYPLDIASNDEDYNTISIGGSLLDINNGYDYNKPSLLFGIPNSLGGLIQNVDFRLVNDGNSFRLERSFEEFNDTPETMWSINDGNGHMNLNFHKVVNMADPTQGDHAVTLNYLNNVINTDTLELSSPGPYSDYLECATYCRSLSEGGHNDWRVPSLDESSQLAGITLPTINYTWTSTVSSIPTGPVPTSSLYLRFLFYHPSGQVVAWPSTDSASCYCIRGVKEN